MGENVFSGFSRDVTKHKQLEEQFRQSQKMEAVGQLVTYGVAHDFNNILAVIQLQTDMLKATCNLSEAQTSFADEIGAASQRAAALTRQLLMFSRKQTIRQHDLDLNQSIKNVTKLLYRTIGKDVEMQLKYAPQIR